MRELVRSGKCSTIAKYAYKFPNSGLRRMRPASGTRPRGDWRYRLARCLFACFAVVGTAMPAVTPPVHADPVGAGPVLERRVKAAFLYKFLAYTDFPASAFADPAAPVNMVIAGSDEMVADVAAITAGRTVASRPIAVRALREGDAAPAHLMFVAGSDCARAGRVIHAIRAFLVVTECDSGLQQGAVINFRVIDEHVRFDVSLDAAERNNVRLSSRLLTVANRVQKGAQ
ncbi:MAG: YfiR family protein [Ramlibacter sp.]